jgi:hypothetical protein
MPHKLPGRGERAKTNKKAQKKRKVARKPMKKRSGY